MELSSKGSSKEPVTVAVAVNIALLFKWIFNNFRRYIDGTLKGRIINFQFSIHRFVSYTKHL